MSNPARVSILMAVFNGQDYLAEAIESVLSQTVSEWELICIDDGSTDSTPAIVASYADVDDRVRLVRLPANRGQPFAMNAALRVASGEFVAVLDADDMATEDRLERSLDEFARSPRLGLLGSSMHVVDTHGQLVGKSDAPAMEDEDVRQALYSSGNVLAHSSVMARRELVERAGGYDTSLPTSQDYDLYLRLAPHCELKRVAPPLVLWRQHPGQKSVMSRAKQVYYAQFARRRALARAEGVAFHEEAELSRVRARASRSLHWLPGEGRRLLVVAQERLRSGESVEARAFFGQALRLCPGLLRAVPWYVVSLAPSNIGKGLITTWEALKRRVRGGFALAGGGSR